MLSFAEKKIEEIAQETNERTQLLVKEHGQGIVLHKQTSPNAVTADTILGKTSPLHATAAGKAMLSAMPDSRIEGIIERWD